MYFTPFRRRRRRHSRKTSISLRCASANWSERGQHEFQHVTPAGGNIFADLKVPDAENEKLRLHLLAAIKEWVSSSGLTQVEAAATMGVKQPTLNDAIKGRYQKFTNDRLVRMLSKGGKQVNITVSG